MSQPQPYSREADSQPNFFTIPPSFSSAVDTPSSEQGRVTMPNHRLILVAGFGLITLTTLWFGFSATSLSQSGTTTLRPVGNLCPEAVTVAGSCDRTTTLTLLETSTILATVHIIPTPAISHDNPHSNEPLFISEDQMEPDPGLHSEPVPFAEHAEPIPEHHAATPVVDKQVAAGAEASDDDDDLNPTLLTRPSPQPSSPSAVQAGTPTTASPKVYLAPQNDDDFDLNEVLTKYVCYPASTDEARKLAVDTVPSLNINVVRGDNLLLNRKPKSTVDAPAAVAAPSFKTWYSIGRKPSPGCWTYADRFARYGQDNSPRFMRTLGAVNNCTESKRAILLHMQKGQSWNSHFLHHLSAIISEAGWLAGYHVYLLVFVDGEADAQADYVNSVIPTAFRPLAITFNNADLRQTVGEEVPFHNYESNTHVAVQKFMAENTGYEFVYSVAASARLVGRWDKLLKSVDDEYAFHRELSEEEQALPPVPDLVTFDAPREPEEGWGALEWACLEFFGADKGKATAKQNVRRSLSAITGYSRRLTTALAELNARKINCNAAYFPATAASHAKLTTFFFQHPLYTVSAATADARLQTAKMGGNDAMTVQTDKVAVDFSYSADATDAQAFWEEWVDNPEVCRPEALLHPVSGQY
ncbi:hypothetical protein Dda_5601 [Drechslerella dactyloides]|uniref:Uncharacterized protein n=1 Tax=Drechslerella dactyloides TaxID=74499 RepID=A0AAD6NJ06_DREDA|nr:hypothetical protein Dda_5601 [Drechslerella dactyloides]